MSIALKRLRETFSDELVRYDRGIVRYSALADELRPRVDDILKRSSQLIDLARQFEPKSFHGVVSVCAAHSTLGYFFAPLVADLAINAPGLQLRAIPYPPPSGVFDKVDLFILPDWLVSRDRQSRILFVEEFSCLAPPGFPSVEAIDDDDYLALRHAALPPGDEELFWPKDSAARELLARRNIQARAAHVEALRFMVVRNELIATMPTRLAHQCAAMSTAYPIRAPKSLTAISLVAQAAPGRGEEPIIKWLIGAIARLTDFFNPPAVAHPSPRPAQE